jgi:hypothetical protein
MTIQELEQKLNECQKALAELKESKKEKWLPKCNEEYWFRATDGEYVRWKRTVGVGVDDWRVHYIPVFKTEKECRRYWHFMDTVKEKSYEFSKEEWFGYGIRKYFIYYDYRVEQVRVGNEYATKDFNKPYFKTEEDAKYIIDNFKDELMEFWI